jgi:uncharacterized glyoxalase superfamily protein PhnB
VNAEENGKGTAGALRIESIAPSLTVADIDASLAWYRDVLGFQVSELWEHDGKVMGADLTAGTVHLMLGQDDWAKGRDRPKGQGFRLYFTSAGDIDALASAIGRRGGTLDSEPEDMPWGARVFSLTDPDGFKLTFAADIDVGE